jgi:hypothetical protein
MFASPVVARGAGLPGSRPVPSSPAGARPRCPGADHEAVAAAAVRPALEIDQQSRTHAAQGEPRGASVASTATAANSRVPDGAVQVVLVEVRGAGLNPRAILVPGPACAGCRDRQNRRGHADETADHERRILARPDPALHVPPRARRKSATRFARERPRLAEQVAPGLFAEATDIIDAFATEARASVPGPAAAFILPRHPVRMRPAHRDAACRPRERRGATAAPL